MLAPLAAAARLALQLLVQFFDIECRSIAVCTHRATAAQKGCHRRDQKNLSHPTPLYLVGFGSQVRRNQRLFQVVTGVARTQQPENEG
jgi:hypothetical protein